MEKEEAEKLNYDMISHHYLSITIKLTAAC